jgi:AraC-like DNA-binding protein
MTVENPHPLFIQQLSLAPSGEWTPQCHGWILVRVTEGLGYCIQRGNACELNIGDGFMSPSSAKMLVRASQLGPLHLQFVRIDPDLFAGLLTVAEWLKLAALQRRSPGLSFFKAGEMTGQKFARLAEQSGAEGPSVRCAWLQLWAKGVERLFAGDTSLPEPDNNKLRRQLRQLVGRMPEIELFRHSLSDLARQLECSERHFSRLFSEEFGVPFRSHQIELRLQHACQLLMDPKEKIAGIAMDSGYRHLGLFNATFKRRFGVTPSEWRRQVQMNLASDRAGCRVSSSKLTRLISRGSSPMYNPDND